MRALTALSLVAGVWAALDVDLSSSDSIKAAAKEVAYDLMTYYKGNQSGQIPGILPGPPPQGDYYWWEGGALWGALIDYWHATGDSTYNEEIMQSLLFQVGPKVDYMPPNWTASMGNDDQAFWAMSALLAAENVFPNPPTDQPQWLALAQSVFNTQTHAPSRDDYCGGGLRWQAILGNTGWTYKNSIANGCYFNLGARLARYLSNDTYAKLATDTWDWITGVGLIDGNYNVYDGAHIETNCTDINHQQFSYNSAIYLQGAAFLYDYTKDPVWEQRINGLLDQLIKVFFPGGVLKEIACESEAKLTCTPDMFSYKGYVHRWLGTVAQLAPWTKDKIMDVMMSSATAAIKQCTGGGPPGYGRTCGFRWDQTAYDGTNGAGQEMNVLGALTGLLFQEYMAPVTNTTGGTSRGDYNAGNGAGPLAQRPITKGDKAGASILTVLVLVLVTGTFAWISTEYFEGNFDWAG